MAPVVAGKAFVAAPRTEALCISRCSGLNQIKNASAKTHPATAHTEWDY